VTADGLPTLDGIVPTVALFDGDLYELQRAPRVPLGRHIHDLPLAANPDEVVETLALHALDLEEQLATGREIRRFLLRILHHRSGRVE
jgi:hypothetical protein